MRPHVVHTSILLDPRVEPLIVWLRDVSGEVSADEVRRVAACLRELRPAWRAIAVRTNDSPATEEPERRALRPEPVLRVDVTLRSPEPLLAGSATTVADARAKLEALSSFALSTPVTIETAIKPTELDRDPALLLVERSHEHWYCECGQPVIMELWQCPRCARPRMPQSASISDAVPTRAAA